MMVFLGGNKLSCGGTCLTEREATMELETNLIYCGDGWFSQQIWGGIPCKRAQ